MTKVFFRDNGCGGFTGIDRDTPLTAIETTKLNALERDIELGLKTFIKVGNALLEIRDGWLYRATHATFEEYCIERWGFKKSQAYRLIDAAEVVRHLSPIGDSIRKGCQTISRHGSRRATRKQQNDTNW